MLNNIKNFSTSILSCFYTDEIEDKEWVWDGASNRYRYKDSGQYASKDAILNLTRQRVDTVKIETKKTFQKLLNGEITLLDWQRDFATQIKILHSQQYMLGRGGYAQTTSADFLEVARSLRLDHYPRLRNLVEEIKNGTLTQGQIENRISMFVAASRQSFYQGQKKATMANGFIFARRFLGLCTPHCGECISYAARGVVNIYDLVPPATNCSCGGRCCCYVEYYKEYPNDS